jgi:hypothetical protein
MAACARCGSPEEEAAWLVCPFCCTSRFRHADDTPTQEVLARRWHLPDEARGFGSSANFTEAAQYRNVDAGAPHGDPAFAKRLWTAVGVSFAHDVLKPVVLHGVSPKERV